MLLLNIYNDGFMNYKYVSWEEFKFILFGLEVLIFERDFVYEDCRYEI